LPTFEDAGWLAWQAGGLAGWRAKDAREDILRRAADNGKPGVHLSTV